VAAIGTDDVINVQSSLLETLIGSGTLGSGPTNPHALF